MKIIFTGVARRDLTEATTWFEEHSVLGGAAFATLIRETVERISQVPFAAPRWPPMPRFRAWTLKRVNYRVFYEIAGRAVRIVAIAHTSRRPGYWLGRLR